MSRKTNKEKAAEEQIARAAEVEKFKKDYPTRLMRLMADFRAINGFSFETTNENPVEFTFTTNMDAQYNRYYNNEYVLPAELTEYDTLFDIAQVESVVKAHYEAVNEIERKGRVMEEVKEKFDDFLCTLNVEEQTLLKSYLRTLYRA